MNFLTREALADYLAISKKSASRILPPSARGARTISDTRILALLNDSRVQMPMQGGMLPTLLTPEQVAQEISINGKPVSAAKVLRWARRRHNPLPHYRVTRNILRFTRTALTAWVTGGDE